MPEATTAVSATDQIAAAAEKTTAAITHFARRLWLAGLGILKVAAEQAQLGLETLERKGEEIEPTVAAPFRRAGEAANTIGRRAGQSVMNVGDLVGNATTKVTAAARRFKAGDVSEEVGRIVEEKLSVALEHLDLPTREDFQALASRIDELTPKSKRGRESHGD